LTLQRAYWAGLRSRTLKRWRKLKKWTAQKKTDSDRALIGLRNMNCQNFTKAKGRQMPEFDFGKYIRKARKGRRDSLRRIAAKQGWYSAMQYVESRNEDEIPNPPDHYKDFQYAAFFDGRNMAIDVFYEVKHWYTKQPFGEIDDPKVPV
jgi:hypothetical protein